MLNHIRVAIQSCRGEFVRRHVWELKEIFPRMQVKRRPIKSLVCLIYRLSWLGGGRGGGTGGPQRVAATCANEDFRYDLIWNRQPGFFFSFLRNP